MDTVTLGAAALTAALSALTFTGEATWYVPGGSACGINSAPNDLVAAIPPSMFSRAVCGREAVVWYGDKNVRVTVTDRCAGCKHGSIDLSRAAFAQLSVLGKGRMKVTWFYVEEEKVKHPSTGELTSYAPGPLGREIRPAQDSRRA